MLEAGCPVDVLRRPDTAWQAVCTRVYPRGASQLKAWRKSVEWQQKSADRFPNDAAGSGWCNEPVVGCDRPKINKIDNGWLRQAG